MSEVTIDHMNEAIAMFMGGIPDGKKYMIFPNNEIFIYHSDYNSQLKYHSSWDWLMNVWHKFRDLKFKDDKLIMQHSDWKSPIDNAICYQSIDSAHVLLYRAIQWYNSIKDKQEANDQNY